MLRELNSAIAAQAEGSSDDTFELNREFHGLVISRSDNVIIRRMLDQLWSMPSALRMYNLQMVADHDPESMVSEHEQIITALEAGDGARVANDVRNHVTKARAEAVEHVEQSGL
jgi:DNA-binding GntR family transcriptional regulator